MADSRSADLLVELGCEELPPRALPRLAQSFFDETCAGLADAGIGISREDSAFFYTPRRMALLLSGVDHRQPDRQQERRGPAKSAAFDTDGQPTPAAEGFARSVGAAVAELDSLKTDKGEWLYFKKEIPGKPLTELLYPILEKALDRLPIPRPMRWSNHEFSFVRPVHWLLVLHGSEVLEGELFGCPAGRHTHGHRVHAPGPHAVTQAADYLGVLEQARVLADPRARRERILDVAMAAGREAGGETRMTGALLEEVCNLVEWPVAIICQFEEIFLEVPQEALVASMEAHQKFFPVLEAGSPSLTPSFVVIANLESRDEGAVREGFERVVRPRLADARFFWEQDLKTPLEGNLEALDAVVFQKMLGSIGDKSRRIAALSKKLAEESKSGPKHAERAALLAKCDLVSHMVGEFPELQGTMGAYYAAASGESGEVAAAIGSHYRPRFSGDEIPGDPAGRMVSLADRMDTLVGIFAAGLKPSGNRDPFALRRSALGVVRILLEGHYTLSLSRLIAAAANQLAEKVAVSPEVLGEVNNFILERLRHYLGEQGASTRQVRSVLAAPLGSLPDLQTRLAALVGFMAREESESLVAANKRIGNILKKSDSEISQKIDAELFEFEHETALFEEVTRLTSLVQPLFDAGDYDAALTHLATLKPPVDNYFDHVMVMDENLAVRANRLAQLAQLKSLFDCVADFSLAD